jgi:hypothetical protein
MDNLYMGREQRIWGILTTFNTDADPAIVSRSAPQTLREWRIVFRQWATEYSFHLTQRSGAIPGASIVIHQPEHGQDCLEIVLLILGVLRLGEPLDLDDPLTYTIWLDFVNDHHVRFEHWEWWKQHRGEFRHV